MPPTSSRRPETFSLPLQLDRSSDLGAGTEPEGTKARAPWRRGRRTSSGCRGIGVTLRLGLREVPAPPAGAGVWRE